MTRTITGSTRTKAVKNFREKAAWTHPGNAQIFMGTTYYLMNGKSYGFQIWQVHSEGESEQKPIKNFGENGAWAYPETAHFFRVPPIISRTRKATNFILCTHVYRLNGNKSPLKISGKVAVGIVRYSLNFHGTSTVHRAHRTLHRHLCDSSAFLSCLYP